MDYPFSADKDAGISLEQNIKAANYRCGQHLRYATLSTSAKDLLFNIFQKDPNRRYSIQQILDHDWMQSASDNVMDDGYRARVNRLHLLPQVKKIIRRIRNLSQTPPNLHYTATSSIDQLHPDMTAQDDAEPDNDTCAQFFHRISKTANKVSISRQEFINGVQELLLDDGCMQSSTPSSHAMCPLVQNCIDELVNVMDLNNDGDIQYEEFRVFYDHIASVPDRGNDASVIYDCVDDDILEALADVLSEGSLSGRHTEREGLADPLPDTADSVRLHHPSTHGTTDVLEGDNDIRPSITPGDASPTKKLRKK